MLTREQIYSLKRGEVIAYENGRGGIQFLYVDTVDLERGKVSGKIDTAMGVNSISIDRLVEFGIDFSKWEGGSEFADEETSEGVNPMYLKLEQTSE